MAMVSLLPAGCMHNHPAPEASDRLRGLRDSMQARQEYALDLAKFAGDHIRDGDYTKARPLLEEALAADPFCVVAHNNFGLVYLHEGDSYRA